MADALNQNVNLANALANFSKVLFGSAPVKVTEEGFGGGTITKGTALSSEAINAMLREMTEGGLSGQGSGGIAGLAAIMGGQKSAGLYNSSTTMQLMNKNATNIAERAALASAPTTTTTTPTKATRTTEQPGLVSTPAGQAGLLLAGASLLKNKKFKKLIGFDDLSSIQESEALAPQSIEALNQSVVADAAGGDYIGTAIQEQFADSGVVESVSSPIIDYASEIGFGFDTSSELLNAGSELLDSGASVASEFVGDLEVFSGDFNFGDLFEFFADGGLIGRDGKKRSKIPGYANGGIFNARIPEKKVNQNSLLSSPQTTGPLALIPRVPMNRKRQSEDESGILVDGAAPGIGGGVAATPAVDSTSTGMFSSISAAVMGAIANAVNNASIEAAIATEGEDIGSSIGVSVGGGVSVGDTVGDTAAGVAAGTSPVGGGIDGGGNAGGVGDAGAADGDASDAGWKSGGEIDGKGTGTSDSNVIRVSDGEYVIPADVVEIIGVDFFDGLREKFHTPVSQGKRRMQ